MLVDSHCHLNYKGLIEEQGAVLDRARQSGVTAMLNISTRESEWRDIVATAERESDVWASIGIHPHEADAHPDIDLGKLVKEAAHPRVVAIGETGLDYYYDHSDRDRQRQSFRTHIHAARETGLPIIVHTRDAEADTAEIMAEEMEQGAYTGVIHCFTASEDFAQKALALGLYISISGIVTFKNAKDLKETAAKLPSDRLLVETDAPFLAPVPHRGKTGEPAFVADTARYLAELRGEEYDALCETTSRNCSTRPGPECGFEAHHFGMRDFDGRTADRQRLGRLRPERAEKPQKPRFDSGGKPHHPNIGRYLAGSAQPVSRQWYRSYRCGDLDP